MDFLNSTVVLFGITQLTTTPFELVAVLLTIISVFGATQLKVGLQYPVGILGTMAYFFVFAHAGLLSSAALQVYFTAVQLYGWWYWVRGGVAMQDGATIRTAPPIGDWGWPKVMLVGVFTTILSLWLAGIINAHFKANSVFADTAILCMSILAQFLLDRKQQKTWVIWGIVNVLSIYVYGISQGLWISGILYCALLVNVFYGYYNWNRVKALQNV